MKASLNMNVLALSLLVFAVLKVTGIVDWSWVTVAFASLMITLVPALLMFVCFALFLSFCFLITLFGGRE